jgi:hypothetical protein
MTVGDRNVNAAALRGTIRAPDGSAILSTTAESTSGGFGPTMRRFITSGVYNGDFNATPASADAPITIANPLPFWTFVAHSGASFGAISVADPTTASGRAISMTLTAGAALDEGHITQLLPVNGSQGRSFVYLPSATFQTGAVVNDIEAVCVSQFLKEDGVTTTGSLVVAAATTTSIGTNTVRDVQSSPNDTGVVPVDAYFLKIRVGLRRNGAADADSVTVRLHEVRLQVGGIQVTIVDGSDPATYGYGSIYQQSGLFWIQPNNGPSGFDPRMILNASDGSIIIAPDNREGVSLFNIGTGQDPYLAMAERTDPGVASTNQARLYVRDNGAGKTQLCVVFSSGAVQVLATQP